MSEELEGMTERDKRRALNRARLLKSFDAAKAKQRRLRREQELAKAEAEELSAQIRVEDAREERDKAYKLERKLDKRAREAYSSWASTLHKLSASNSS